MNKTIEERAQDYYKAVFDKETLELIDLASGKKTKPSKCLTDEYNFDGEYTDDKAREILEARSYGLEKKTIYYVTLAGGGPAARLKVEVDGAGEIEYASLQYCDWFEKWTDAPNQDSELVERYAYLVGYYGN